MRLNTYLNYGGNCAEAFQFYAEHLGARIGMMMKHGDMPDPSKVQPEMKDSILHAQITIGDSVIMASDVPPDQFKPMRSVYLTLNVEDDAEAERIYKLLVEGGEIYMPLQETFFASRYAILRDRFGTSWMVMHERPMGDRP
ncbi:MAG: VOC family protein [Acidobacteria bacterium]|nr:VOC family protein [Acidobacteriota bacterium]